MPLEKPKATRQGLHLNGWRVSWHIAVTAVVIVGNAFVAQYRIGQLEGGLEQVAQTARKVDVIENRVTNNEDAIRWHRLREHSVHGTVPNTGIIDEDR